MNPATRVLSIALLLGACATAPRAERVDEALFQGHSVAEVVEAARIAVQEVGHPRFEVRASEDSVMTEGPIGVCGRDVACGEWSGTGFSTGTPWTTVKVRLRELAGGTAAEVEIDYESRAHCKRGYRQPAGVECSAQPLGSTGNLEHRILEGIRAHLGAAQVAGAPLD